MKAFLIVSVFHVFLLNIHLGNDKAPLVLTRISIKSIKSISLNKKNKNSRFNRTKNGSVQARTIYSGIDKLVNNIKTHYPPMAIRMNFQGDGKIKMILDLQKGVVSNVELIKSTGRKILDKQMRIDSKKFTFRPVRSNIARLSVIKEFKYILE